MHQRLLTAANQSPQNFYSFGAERRIFKLRSNNGDSVVASYGIVDVRPRWTDGTLQVAIRPNIIAGDYEGGIAGMITAPTYEPFETNNRQAMFETVALEKNGEIFPLTYSHTISGGIHVYELPWPTSDWANIYLRIGMRHVEERWPLDIPLYSSQLAFEQRLNATEFVLPEVVQ